MKITNFKVGVLTSILAGIKLNKISDGETKYTLLKDYLVLRKITNEFEDAKTAIVQKFQDDYKDEIPKVIALRKENKPLDGYEDFVSAEAEANDFIETIAQTEVEVELVPVNKKYLLEASGEDNLTLDTVAFLIENNILE